MQLTGREKCFLLTRDNLFGHQISDELLLTECWEDFPNQSMGLTEIESVNEKEEMQITDVSKLINCTYILLDLHNCNPMLSTFGN